MTNITAQNKEFEIALKDAAKRVLKDSIDINHYVETTLGEMYWGGNKAYADDQGNEYHYEFSKHDTKTGNPETVSI